MGEIFLVLSFVVQAAAAIQAVRLAVLRRHIGWVLLALANALMLARRGATLFAVFSQHQTVDPVAEFIALLISLLMAVGLTLLLRWLKHGNAEADSPEAIQNGALKRLQRQSVLLALLCLLGCAVLSYFAYTSNRDAVSNRLTRDSLELANVLVAAVSAAPDNATALHELDRLWRLPKNRHQDCHLSVIGADAKLLLDTRRPEMVGTFVGATVIRAGVNPPYTVQELIQAHDDWAGSNLNAEGEPQIAAYAYSSNLNALVVVDLAAAAVEAEIRAAALPWGVGFGVIFLVLLPLSFGLLFYVGTSSQKAAFQALNRQLESQRRYAVLVENVKDHAIFLLDAEGRVSTWNPGAESIRGWTEAEIKGRPLAAFYTDEDRTLQQPERDLQTASESGRLETEGWRMRQDGSRFWASVTISSVRDGSGKTRGYLVVTRDVSENRRSQEALQASEERFRIATETANDVVYEWDLKQSVQWLGKIDEMLGFEPGEFPRTLDGWAASVHPEDLERTMAAVEAHLKGGVSYAAEYRVRRKDGVYRWWAARGVATRTPDGRPVRWIGSITDITERKHAEEALRESERLYRGIGESIDYGVWVCAPDGRNIYASESFLRLVGITQEQCSNFGWGEVLHPDDAERTIAAWKECVRTGGNWDIEHRFRGVDGQWHPILARGVPVRNDQGQITCWAGINLDISRIKRAEEATAESQRLLQDITDNSTSLIYALDLEGKFLLINRRLESVLGQPREALIGKSRGAIMPPEIAAAHRANDLRVMETRRATNSDEENIEADGKHHYLSVKFPLMDLQGRLRGIGGVSTDITDRKRAEEKLRETNEYLENLFDHANAPIIVWDLQFKITRFNHAFAALTGRRADEVMGKSLEILFPPALVDSSMALIKQTTGGERWETVEISILHLDGSVRTVLWNSATVFAADGKTPVATIAQGQDITERKRAEEELRVRNQELERFNRLATGREMRIIELKQQVNDLAAELGRLPPYPLAFMDAAAADTVRATLKAADTPSPLDASQTSNQEDKAP